jgi:hypothetical protein
MTILLTDGLTHEKQARLIVLIDVSKTQKNPPNYSRNGLCSFTLTLKGDLSTDSNYLLQSGNYYHDVFWKSPGDSPSYLYSYIVLEYSDWRKCEILANPDI